MNANPIYIILVIPLLFFQCELEMLRPLSFVNIAVPEPSGLSLDHKKDQLWTLSDRNGDVYRLNLEGEVLERLDVDLDDPEGIVFMPDDSLPTVVEEAKNHILRIRTKSGKTDKLEIGVEGHKENGWEGMAFDPVQSVLYLAREKNPATLFLFQYPSMDMIGNHLLKSIPDMSGLDVNPINGEIWILSDEGRTINLYSPDFSFKQSWFHGIPKGEGLAMDFEKGLMYIVSDEQSKLYKYKIPRPN